jgi:hypothetical protein
MHPFALGLEIIRIVDSLYIHLLASHLHGVHYLRASLTGFQHNHNTQDLWKFLSSPHSRDLQKKSPYTLFFQDAISRSAKSSDIWLADGTTVSQFLF